MNLIIDTDSYKASHWLQYPPGTVNLFNYLESRGGEYDRTVFFGLQYLLKEYLTKGIRRHDVEEANWFFTSHGLPFNLKGWTGIINQHGGYIPLRINALPEGTVVPNHLPLLTAEATDPEFFWVVGWFETMIMRLWYPITVATVSWYVKQMIKRYLNETADDLSGLPFKLHDFGSRGVSSRESAAIGGAAHLVNFMGSDTVPGVFLANDCYGLKSGMAGFSIPAAEHSTITSWGRENEVEAYRNMLKQFAKPGGLVAVVSDSYNIYDAAEKLWGDTLRQEVVSSGATVVIRPDSGDPTGVVLRLLEILDGKFGSKVNSKGFKVLNNVRIIQGDGIGPNQVGHILWAAQQIGFSADNLAFGMGGGLLQKVNRDTQKFAYKCSAIHLRPVLNGKTATNGYAEWRDVYKDPVDDHGKTSKRGRVGLAYRDGYVTCKDSDPDNLLTPVFENGEILRTTTFDEVRERSNDVR